MKGRSKFTKWLDFFHEKLHSLTFNTRITEDWEIPEVYFYDFHSRVSSPDFLLQASSEYATFTRTRSTETSFEKTSSVNSATPRFG